MRILWAGVDFRNILPTILIWPFEPSVKVLEGNALKCMEIILDLYLMSQEGWGEGAGNPRGDTLQRTCLEFDGIRDKCIGLRYICMFLPMYSLSLAIFNLIMRFAGVGGGPSCPLEA